MIEALGVMSEEVQQYLINFDIALEAFKRGQLPHVDVIDTLLEGRSEDLPARLYAESAASGKKKLEEIMKELLINFAKGGFPDTIRLGEEDHVVEFQVISYARSPRTNILYAIVAAPKDYTIFWQKSIENIALQSETGHMDHQRFRLIVESQTARKFRRQRDYGRLTRTEKSKYESELRDKLFKGKKYKNLSEAEREKFHEEFVADWWRLTPAERKAYARAYQKPNRDISRSLPGKFALQPGFDTIPINPHYMKLGGLTFRVQRQFIINHDLDTVLEYECLMDISGRRDLNPFDAVFESAYDRRYAIEKPSQDVLGYTDFNGKPAVLVNLDGLLVNFHIHDPSAPINIDALKEKINAYYSAAVKAWSREDDPHERQNRIMEGIRLGMEDLPLGFVILSQTTRTDLENKYLEVFFDEADSQKTFIKDRIGEKAEKRTGFEDTKFYIVLRQESLSVECQVMDPIMLERAELGEAQKPKSRLEWFAEKARRNGRRERAIVTQDHIDFGRAHFTKGEASDQLFSGKYAGLCVKTIEGIVQEIATMTYIPPPRDKSPDRTRFEGLVERIREAYKIAQHTSNQADLGKVTEAINKTLDAYTESKGRAILGFNDSLWEVSQSLKQASEQLDGNFKYFGDSIQFSEALHRRHIELLCQTYQELVNLAAQQTLREGAKYMAASLFVRLLIKEYNTYYPERLPPGVVQEKLGKIEHFCLGTGMEAYTFMGRRLGYIQSRFRAKDAIKNAVIDGTGVVKEVLTPLKEFDLDTLDNIKIAYNKFVRAQ